MAKKKEVEAPPKLKDLAVTDPRRLACERERRRYVKRGGGLCKGLTPNQKELAEALCSAYGRPPEEGWDCTGPVIEGMR